MEEVVRLTHQTGGGDAVSAWPDAPGVTSAMLQKEDRCLAADQNDVAVSMLSIIHRACDEISSHG
ncbi:hypothetical protein [Phenylobacterium sp.]|uniref:hypothetical protein n=1 Tax=Phenylobacterium sp. TaxID=1871053 RepID=UPI0028118E76|nr:hypothetical protein [Phenylobacterium sp.]